MDSDQSNTTTEQDGVVCACSCQQRIAELEGLLREEHELTGCYQDARYPDPDGARSAESKYCHVCAALAPEGD